MDKKINSYVCEIDPEQAETLGKILNELGWDISDQPHAYWKAKKEKTTVAAYKSGKLTVQGKGTSDFVTFILEPEILKEASLGYENINKETGKPKPFQAHAGIDESGKGDFFGPLVISAVFVADEKINEKLLKLGVKDSKAIKNKLKIQNLASDIKKTVGDAFSIISIGPEAYNKMYSNIKNLNRLLAWGHARALENLLEKTSDCNSALADKFGNESLIKNALMERGKKIELRQQTKAESDIAVAAASILARDAFVRKMDALGKDLGSTLPLGAGNNVFECAVKIIKDKGFEQLDSIAKMHFKTAEKALNASLLAE
jgi:ribonuclease HIII